MTTQHGIQDINPEGVGGRCTGRDGDRLNWNYEKTSRIKQSLMNFKMVCIICEI